MLCILLQAVGVQFFGATAGTWLHATSPVSHSMANAVREAVLVAPSQSYQPCPKPTPYLSAALLHSVAVAHNLDGLLALNELPHAIARQDDELVLGRQLDHGAVRL